MGRKTKATEHSEKINQAAADAAAIITTDAAGISTAIRQYLAAANKEEDHWLRAALFDQAMKLVDAQAKLGETIGKIKGEMRQQIRVTRVMDRTGIAPQSAPNSARPAHEKPRQTANNHGEDPVSPRGEGEGPSHSGNGKDHAPGNGKDHAPGNGTGGSHGNGNGKDRPPGNGADLRALIHSAKTMDDFRKILDLLPR